MVSPLNTFLTSSYASSMVDALFKPLSSQGLGAVAAKTVTPSVSSASSSANVTSTAIAAIQALVKGGAPVSAPAAAIQAIVTGAGANSGAGQSSTVAVSEAYAGTASGQQTFQTATAIGTSSSIPAWVAKDIAEFYAAQDPALSLEQNGPSQAEMRWVSATINKSFVFVPASQVAGSDVTIDRETWGASYSYNGHAVNAFARSLGMHGAGVVWGDTPAESLVILD
jgi:hypothetical protein